MRDLLDEFDTSILAIYEDKINLTLSIMRKLWFSAIASGSHTSLKGIKFFLLHRIYAFEVVTVDEAPNMVFDDDDTSMGWHILKHHNLSFLIWDFLIPRSFFFSVHLPLRHNEKNALSEAKL